MKKIYDLSQTPAFSAHNLLNHDHKKIKHMKTKVTNYSLSYSLIKNFLLAALFSLLLFLNGNKVWGQCNRVTCNYVGDPTAATTAWQSVSGSIPNGTTYNRYDFYLYSGNTYEFSMCSVDGGSANYDSYLCLYGPGYGCGYTSFVANDDDACAPASKITYISSFTGWSSLYVSGWSTNSGSYTLRYKYTAPGNTPPANSNLSYNCTGASYNLLQQYAGQSYTWCLDYTDANGATNLDWGWFGYYLEADGSWSELFIIQLDIDANAFSILGGASNVSVTSVTRAAITNGYRYTFVFTPLWNMGSADNCGYDVVPVYGVQDDIGSRVPPSGYTVWWYGDNSNIQIENDVRVYSVNYTTPQTYNTSFNVNGVIEYEGVTTPDPPNVFDVRIDPDWTGINYDDNDCPAGAYSIDFLSNTVCATNNFTVTIYSYPTGAGITDDLSNSITTINCCTPPTTSPAASHTQTNQSTTNVRFTWTTPGDADGVNVYRASDGTLLQSGNTAQYYDYTTTVNTQVGIKVKAYKGATTCENSSFGTASSAYSSQNTPTSITFSSVGTASITATANGTFPNQSVGSSGVYIRNSTNSTNSGTMTTTTSWVNGSLTCNTSYSYYAKAFNGDGDVTTEIGPTSQSTSACEMIVPFTGNNSYTVCSGHLYDHGGSTDNYSDYAEGYTVLNPSVGGNVIQISGTTAGESCCDYVVVHNGVGTGGTVLGTYYMNTAIPILTSTDVSGALTVRFHSDVSITGAGIDITISCVAGCSAPAAPANCSSIIGTPPNGLEHHISISCATVSGADGYDFDWSPDNSTWYDLVESSSSSYDDNRGNNPNTPYYYRARAYKCTPKQYSSWVNNSTFPVYTACDEPASPTVGSPTSSTLNVTLNPESPVANPAITTYSIYCVTTANYVTATGALGTEVYQTKAAWGTITVTGLTCNTSYTFYAKAQNALGDVRYNASNTGSASTTLVNGHYLNTEIVTSGNSFSRDNTDACKTNQVTTYSCSSWDESGKEHWFQIAMTAGQILDVVQTEASVDIDYFITDAAGSNTCYDGAYGNTIATAAIGSSGNYYISCDGYNGVSGTFTISVNSVNPPTIAEAAPTTVCSGSAVTLTAGGGGGGGAIIDWYSGSCNGTYVGSGTPLTVYPTSNTSYFAAYYINGKITSCVATASVTVNPSPSITGEPSSSGITYGDNATFTVTASNGTTYQWEEYISSWNPLSNAGIYSGVNTATLLLTKPTVAISGRNYRCVVSGACSPAATSDGNATLTVAPKELTVTANTGQSKYFGQTDPVFTYGASGFVTGENESVLSGALGRVSGEPVGLYALTVGSLSADNYSLNFASANFEIKAAYVLDISAFLQGSYAGSGLMNTFLKTASQLPLNQPYENVAPWYYTGNESVTTIPDDVVDWVLVELRSDVNTTLEKKAGLLYKDGSIRISFSGSSTGGDYVVVWHRNHMPVMSVGKVDLPISGAAYNLTASANLYGTNPAINLGDGNHAMIAGDVTHNGVLHYSGPGNDRGAIIAKIAEIEGSGATINSVVTGGYWFADVNLNNELRYIGGNDDRSVILTNLGALTGNYQTNSVYYSAVPGFGSKDQGSNDGPFNIQISEYNQHISFEIITNEPVVNGIVDNIQFTLAWKTGDTEIAELLNSFTSDFMLAPQGEALEVNGVMHRVYVSVTPVELPDIFNEGDVVTVLSFENNTGQSLTGRLWIADNDFTAENNAMYYVSVWGNDFTGMILGPATGMEEIPEMESVNLYPNPVTKGEVNVAMNLAKAQEVTILVTDMQGKLISTTTIIATAGLSSTTLDLDGLFIGVYFVRISGDNLNTVEKLIVK
jgi:hypothetical protein